jgi:hypothetical protein
MKYLETLTSLRSWTTSDGTQGTKSTTFDISFCSRTNTFTIDFDDDTTPVLDLQKLLGMFQYINPVDLCQLWEFECAIGMQQLRHIVKHPDDAIFVSSLSELGLQSEASLAQLSSKYQEICRRGQREPEFVPPKLESWIYILQVQVNENIESPFAQAGSGID